MKKLLFVPMLLGLILLIFSFNDASGTTSSVDKDLTYTKANFVEKRADVYNSNYNDINYSSNIEVVENSESNFSVTIGSDRNTTRDTNESFIARVYNANNIESCNYLWSIIDERDNKKNAFGKEVELSFPKGESSVTVRVICGEQEANATVKVIAWEYFEKKVYHYNAYYGELEYVEREIFDYRGRYLIEDDGTFSKVSFLYDDEGRLVERTTLYYHYPSESEITKFTYNSEGKKVSEKRFDLNRNIRFVSLFEYNKDGELVLIKSGSDMEHLYEVQQYIYDASTEKQLPLYDSSNVVSTEDIGSRRIVNDDGMVTYEEYNYGYFKTVDKYSYYDNGNIKVGRHEIASDEEIKVDIISYGKSGKIVSKERSIKSKKNSYECSYKTDYTYNKQGDVDSSVNTILDGECPYIDEVKRKFAYDESGNITNIYSVFDDDVKNGYTTMRVEQFYTNELEEF